MEALKISKEVAEEIKEAIWKVFLDDNVARVNPVVGASVTNMACIVIDSFVEVIEENDVNQEAS